MICLGVDPGLGGAVALLNTDGMDLQVWDMPTKQEGKKRRLDAVEYLNIMDEVWQYSSKINRVYVEAVTAMPGQGVSSMFSFGQVFGAQVMGLHAYDFTPTFVRPSVWKPALGIGASKDSSLIACLDLFNERYRHLWFGRNMGVLDGRCEATLIAYYGSKRR